MAVEAGSIDRLHREVALIVQPPDFEDRHDVWVIEQSNRLCLVLKPAEVVIGGELPAWSILRATSRFKLIWRAR
jgi:hypothetical protein